MSNFCAARRFAAFLAGAPFGLPGKPGVYLMHDARDEIIYVGKAVPDGARKGGQGDDVDPGTALFKRLTDHAKSVDATTNLKLEDFRCRFLSVDDIWIPLTESLLIERFKPVWNRVLDGFGNHDPGKGRHRGRMPLWDCLHPGRAWAERLQPCAFTAEELEQRVRKYLNDALL